MSDLPKSVHINEEGPREGFQIEKGHIATARKIELIDALAKTGLDHIQIVSFVNPKAVPGMADAEAVVHGVTPQPGVAYTGLWLNEKGFERAVAVGRLELTGVIQLAASPTFLKRNQNRTPEAQLQAQHNLVAMYKANGIAVERGSLMAAFGCNFEGDIPTERVVDLVGQILDVARENNVTLKYVSLADTMAWATPASIKRVLGAIRNRFADLDIALHLHDTRGMGIANAYAGIEMGVTLFEPRSRALAAARLPVTPAPPATSALRISSSCAVRSESKPASISSADRMRAARRGRRRPSASGLGDEGRQLAQAPCEGGRFVARMSAATCGTAAFPDVATLIRATF